VVAVLGYSPRRGSGLHPICAARLARAASMTRPGDVVVLSGWSRRGGGESEADLMARSWPGPDVRLVRDRGARHTAENAAGIAAVALALGARELVVVTSTWHRFRAGFLVRRALRGTGLPLTTVGTRSRRSLPLLGREVLCAAALPAQLVRPPRPRHPSRPEEPPPGRRA
jgi:uncharacterized SAM-binding protein YcdF (DUF218 family)